ncbi:MAG: methylenetetrahydrofolate reductase, partial [Candidatus Marinimicrobia bacterium]|nr:methylenetetrahydrofolate reductase [Candidatus Neomarinimicrobiota bacterium]
LLKQLNRGLDMGGRSMQGQTAFTIGVAANPAAQNIEREMERLERKAEVGGEFIMTQPIYDHDLLRDFLGRVAPLKLPVLMGILPLASYRNAEFLHNEVPGMTVPADVRERMRKAGDNGLEEGIAIAQEMLLAMKDVAAGVYVMPPFNRFSVAVKVLEPLELQPGGAAV